jgi:cytoskeletal protein RodZ
MKKLTMFLVSVVSIMVIGMLGMLIYAFRGVDWQMYIDAIIKNSTTAYAESSSEPIIIINSDSPINAPNEDNDSGRPSDEMPERPETAVFAPLPTMPAPAAATPETAVSHQPTRVPVTVTYQAACDDASAGGRRSNPRCNPTYATSTPAGVGR